MPMKDKLGNASASLFSSKVMYFLRYFTAKFGTRALSWVKSRYL